MADSDQKPSTDAPRALMSYRKYWAHRLTPAPVLPMSRAEMDELGWDSCDVIIVTGDAYVDHPSFGMAIVGRFLEAQGFRVGIIAQPDWRSVADFEALGAPNLFFGVAAGNMDSMVNRYTADRKVRSDDAYTPGGAGGKRPDRSVIVYSNRLREAFKGTPIVIGGIEASLRRIAHFDYWSEKVRRSVLLDAKADLLVFGNAERQLVEIAHRMAAGEDINDITDVRGTAFKRSRTPAGWTEIDSTHLDMPGRLNPADDPYAMRPDSQQQTPEGDDEVQVVRFVRDVPSAARATSVIRLPSFEQVEDPGVAESAADSGVHQGIGRGVRAALHAEAASVLWRGADTSLRNDPLFGFHPAWLLRRVYVLLDYRA
jgi:uncharacterized radical SAM protein YgiQ